VKPDLEAILARINPPEEIESLHDVRSLVNSSDRYSLIEKRFFEEVVELFADLQGAQIPGDVLVAGVWRGGSAVYFQALNRKFGLSKKLWLLDTFSGFVHDSIQHKKDQWSLRMLKKFEQPETSIFPGAAEVEQLFRTCELWDELVSIVPGALEATLPTLGVERLALLHIDVDFYEPTRAALELAYPKLAPGGYVIIDDYGVGAFNCKEAVDEFRAQHGIVAPMRFMTSYAVCWKKPHA
jgi:O-methyltransferase